jgi:monoterpene epsilon-lactone hydrolase
MRDPHNRSGQGASIIVDVDDDRAAVLPFPQAPDAIELRHVRAFVAVAEELNFSRASERLHLSQPALSRQIRALERLLACELLTRSTHRVELTLAGEAFLDRARPLLRDVDEAVRMARSVGGELVGRVARLWEPFVDLFATNPGIDDTRAAWEALQGQFAPPPEIGLRPVNAGGVPSLLLSAEPQRPGMLLYLHGGGYVLGSAFGYRHLAGALAMAADTVALVPDYRLAPEHPFPAGLEDCVRAYRWILERGAAPERIAVAGDSSGGGLVLSLLLTLRERDIALPGRAVLLCPSVDLTFTVRSDAEDQSGAAAASAELRRRFTGPYLAGHPVDDPVVSPLLADLHGLPPMLIQAATGDELLAQAHRLTEHARGCGVDARLELYPTAPHDFQLFWSFLPEAADAIQRAGRFCAEIASADGARAAR